MAVSATTSRNRSEAGEKRDLQGLVGYQLRRVGALVAKELGKILGKVGLAPGQFSILLLIAERPGCTQTDLAQLTGLDRSTLMPVIDRLRHLGFLLRKQNREDRRAYYLFVSADGNRALRKLMPYVRSFEDKITRDFNYKEKERLLHSLSLLEQSLTAHGAALSP